MTTLTAVKARQAAPIKTPTDLGADATRDISAALTGLAGASARGLSAADVRARTQALIDDAACSIHDEPQAALDHAHAAAASGERVLVFGSFHLVSALAPALNRIAVPAN